MKSKFWDSVHLDRLAWGLILSSLILGLYIYAPIIELETRYRFAPEQSYAQTEAEFSVEIPDLNLSQPIVASVDPFDPNAYQPILKNGLAHASNSALPGESGQVFVFGHSSDNPWSITRYNTSFYLLHKAKVGQIVTLNYQGKAHRYRIDKIVQVIPDQVEYLLNQTDQQRLVLQTCAPIGTDWYRLLVIAEPI